MTNQLIKDPTEYRVYRCDSPVNGSKDWAIGVDESGDLRVRFGVTGKTMQLRVAAQVVIGDVHREMDRRIREKLRDGYAPIGKGHIRSGRLEFKPEAKPWALDWAIRTPIEPPILHDFLHDQATRLNQLALTGGIPMPGGADVEIVEDGIRVFHTGSPWSFGYMAGGGILADHTGGNTIHQGHGPIPVLLMMALSEHCPNTVVFGQDGNEVKLSMQRSNEFLQADLWGWDILEQIGAELGLCLPKLEWSQLASGESSWF